MILNLKQAAAFLHRKNVVYFRQNIKKWGIPHQRVGRDYVFTEEALLAYCSRQAPERETCHSDEQEAVSGRSALKEYQNLLAQVSTKTRKHSKTS